LRMKSTEIAHTDDCRSDFLHHTGIMPRPVAGSRSRLEEFTLPTSSSAAHPRTSRELLILVGALLMGLIVAPLAIWLVGNRVLGPYTHGTNTTAGPMALLGDFFRGLAHWTVSSWVIALGPLLIIQFTRGAWVLIRGPGKRAPPGP